MYIKHYSLRLSINATLCHPSASCTDPASMKTYNDKTRFYKQSYDYMYASYVYTYAMGAFSERVCSIILSYTRV